MSDTLAINAAFVSVGTVLVSAAAVTTRPGRGVTRSPSRMALSASLGVLGVSFVVQSPLAREPQNEVLVNLGQLTGNGTTLVAAFAAQVMVLFIRYEPAAATAKAWRRLALLLVALGAMTAFFLTTPVARDRFTSPSPPGGIVAYYLAFSGYLIITLTSLFQLARRYAGRATDSSVRLSMSLLGWACVVGAGYLAARLAILATGSFGLEIALRGDAFGHLEFVVAAVLPACGALFVAAGIVVGGWGRRLPDPARWLRHRRSYRRLRPLWEAVSDAQPHLVLPVRAGIRGGQLRLYRRVVEIQDAWFAVMGCVNAELCQRIDAAVAAAGRAEDSAAVREAAMFAAGLRLLSEGQVPAGVPFDAAADRGDLPDVVAWLERVSIAYATSPVVRRFAAPDAARDSTSG